MTDVEQTNQDRQDLVVAIDGPAAAGKSTVASAVARRIDAVYFDTGVIYRVLALKALKEHVNAADAQALTDLAKHLPVRIAAPSHRDGRQFDVLLGGEDVTWEIRSPEVDRVVSEVSAHPSVREALLGLQRKIGRSGRVVMAGRDIGTVVMPDADVKVWLDASLEERARRRSLDIARSGREAPIGAVKDDLAARDAIDASRASAPMKAAPDAICILTDGRTVDQVVDEIVRLVEAEQAGSR